jgi:predicted DNA-binding transcriptional regulator AlpA
VINNTLPQTGFVRLPQILAAIPIGKSTWWAGCKSGKLPKPIKSLGANTTVWKTEDIHALIKQLAEGEVQ